MITVFKNLGDHPVKISSSKGWANLRNGDLLICKGGKDDYVVEAKLKNRRRKTKVENLIVMELPNELPDSFWENRLL